MRNTKKISKRVYQAIGHMRVGQIQPHHLLEFYDALSKLDHKGAVYYIANTDIKSLLAEKGINTAQFSSIVHISRRTLSRIYLGDKVYKETAEPIAKFFGLPLEKLFSPTSRGGKLAPKTIKHYHTFISSVLERAVKWQIIAENPCRRIDPPKMVKQEIQCMDANEAARFLACLENEPIQDRALFSLLLFMGMRRGEALGLNWEDIDFETGVITIRRTSQYLPKKGMYEDATKTEQSKRSIRAPSVVLEILKEHRSSQNIKRLSLGDQWKCSPRVFTNCNGSDMSVNMPYKRLKAIESKYGLPNVNLHSLRHTNATLLIQQGVSIRTVSGRLGHSQTSTTMNIYAHQLQSADAAAAEALELALKKPKQA